MMMLKAVVLAAIAASTLGWMDDGCMDTFTPAGDVGDAEGVFLTDGGAMAIDGSPAVYYIRPGTGDGMNKWYIHHQGGGWCESPADCYGRSKMSLGSSVGFAPTATLGGGYFSSDCTVNPQMCTWNMVFMRYLDGGSFSGSRQDPLMYNNGSADIPLMFRGHNNLHAIMTDLFTKRGLGNATDAVISGCSAGGLATYLHVDEWADRLHAVNKDMTVRGMPDSGFFLDYQAPGVDPSPPQSRHLTTIPGNYHNGLKWVFDNMNTVQGLNEDCVKDKSGSPDLYMCQFAEHTCPYLRTAIFPLQSEYDAWQTGHVLATPSDAMITEMGVNITSRLKSDLLLSKVQPNHGVFLDSCHHHCGAWGEIVIDGQDQAAAFSQWYSDPSKKRLWIQGKPYPCDSCCKP